ncbi:MAG: hypothetical protein DRN08_06245 [Thermoplasmata archaeon]|nr:MAG: hypothetical protein DRN08_06245 [Thermoplasmata archaeon]
MWLCQQQAPQIPAWKPYIHLLVRRVLGVVTRNLCQNIGWKIFRGPVPPEKLLTLDLAETMEWQQLGAQGPFPVRLLRQGERYAVPGYLTEWMAIMEDIWT